MQMYGIGDGYSNFSVAARIQEDYTTSGNNAMFNHRSNDCAITCNDSPLRIFQYSCTNMMHFDNNGSKLRTFSQIPVTAYLPSGSDAMFAYENKDSVTYPRVNNHRSSFTITIIRINDVTSSQKVMSTSLNV